MKITNRYRTVCSVCARPVRAREGAVCKEGGQWIGYCAPHAPQVDADSAQVRDYTDIDGRVESYNAELTREYRVW